MHDLSVRDTGKIVYWVASLIVFFVIFDVWQNLGDEQMQMATGRDADADSDDGSNFDGCDASDEEREMPRCKELEWDNSTLTFWAGTFPLSRPPPLLRPLDRHLLLFVLLLTKELHFCLLW